VLRLDRYSRQGTTNQELLLTGDNLTVTQLVRFARTPSMRVRFDQRSLAGVARAAEFLQAREGPRDAAAVRRLAEPPRPRPRPPGCLAADVLRAALLLRLNALLLGYSGASVRVVDVLARLLNAGVVPLVPWSALVTDRGRSVLSHVSDLLRGEGWFRVVQSRTDVRRVPRPTEIFAAANLPSAIAPTSAAMFDSRDGTTVSWQISPLNTDDEQALESGPSVATAILALAIHEARIVAKTADLAAALTLEGTCASPDAFTPLVNYVRPHRGQCIVAWKIDTLIHGSQLVNVAPGRPLSGPALSRSPVTHGASRDLIRYARGVLATDINAATHDRLVIPEAREVYATANGHGLPISVAARVISMAASELTQVSRERQRLTSGSASTPNSRSATSAAAKNARSAVEEAVAARARVAEAQRAIADELIAAVHAIRQRGGEGTVVRSTAPGVADTPDFRHASPRTRLVCRAIVTPEDRPRLGSTDEPNVARVRRLVISGRLIRLSAIRRPSS
jgi:hypothetical protein